MRLIALLLAALLPFPALAAVMLVVPPAITLNEGQAFTYHIWVNVTAAEPVTGASVFLTSPTPGRFTITGRSTDNAASGPTPFEALYDYALLAHPAIGPAPREVGGGIPFPSLPLGNGMWFIADLDIALTAPAGTYALNLDGAYYTNDTTPHAYAGPAATVITVVVPEPSDGAAMFFCAAAAYLLLKRR